MQQERAAPAPSGRRVLVIDDYDAAREYMTRLLTAAGFVVFSQSSPIGATRMIVRERINVVVIDLHMPAIRGDKLVALFRQNPRFKNLGLVLVSGVAESELETLGRAVSADAIVPKRSLDSSLVTEVSKLASRS